MHKSRSFLSLLQKPKRQSEEKQLVREGRNSLIAFPNASSFSVFSHVRHFVLQSQLCETYNSRLGLLGGSEEGGEAEGGDDEEATKKDEGGKMPVVCSTLCVFRLEASCFVPEFIMSHSAPYMEWIVPLSLRARGISFVFCYMCHLNCP